MEVNYFFKKVPVYHYLKSLVFCTVFLLNNNYSIAQKSVKFNVESPELLTTESLKDFIIKTEKPKVVVRYSTFDYDKSQIDLDYLYNVIEKEFIKGGYSVKDRILFDEVVNRSEDLLDYSTIQEKTDTELIFEIVKLDTDQEYITNSYYTNKGVLRELYKDGEVHVMGASVEFKLIIVEDNELAGSYVFHYVPCEKGCPIRLNDYEVVFEDDFGDKLPNDVYQKVTQSQLEEFLEKSTRQLIGHLNQIKKSSSSIQSQ